MPHFVDPSPAGVCIFCRIVQGEIPSAKVYEDALTIAFMDLGQVNPGHVLVATKRHAANIFEITDEESAAVMQTARKVALAAKIAFEPAGLTLLQANGVEGGQTVAHFHLHVVPRHADDGVSFSWPRKEPGGAVLEGYALQLRNAMLSQSAPAAAVA
ncbi:HIT family protein [Comamonas sp. MYb396]|uniref:HIT family protein n=1 Tax=Comamonas sp. MYb396 TaxID=2745302 RepID=UPI00309A47D7